MKLKILSPLKHPLISLTLALALPAFAQETIVEDKPTTADGVISELKTDKITITTGTSTDPLRFTYSKGTEFVDELSAPSSVTALKPGVPVTIHYAAVGDDMVANKIVVKRTSKVPNAIADTTIVTAMGTISEFGPERMIVSTDSSSEPFGYTLTKNTAFVDESGKVVTTTSVKSGIPVTVHYTKSGDKMIASKVIVRKSVPAAAAATMSMGTISEFSPEALVLRTESSKEPLRYKFTKTTTWVDDSGSPVSMELVKSGLPVTVHYTTEGNARVATKVVVRKKTTTSAVPR
jgi:hypothetical protein